MSDPSLDKNGPLARDLARLFAPSAPPAAVDDTLRRAARNQLTQAPARRVAPWIVAGAAAAAALLLAFGAQWFLGRGTGTEVLAADVDGSGRIDILDAWALARSLEGGDALEPAWDLDGDGAVDRRDVDHLARRAVRLDR